MYDYSTTSRRTSRFTFFLIAAVALLFISMCMLSAAGVTLFTVATSQRSDAEIVRPPSQNIAFRQALQPTPQVIVQPPPEGVDYETAVLRSIYERVNKSVVAITVLSSHLTATGFNIPSDDQELLPFASGSGFVWDLAGHIVTNNHVVDGADKLEVTFSDGATALADVVGTDQDSDLAVIKIDPSGFELTPVILGNMDEVFVGMRVAAIGNPFGLAGTLTSGIVSAIGRSIPSLSNFNIPDSIQTDAAINPGNSGGPLLNERGEVIGVNAQIRSEVRANSGVGFAIPIAIVERVVPSLIEHGRYTHSYMGISGATFSPLCSQEQNLTPEQRGVLVQDVIRGGPAARAGLNGATSRITSAFPGICPSTTGGDFIVAVNGTPVSTFDDILIYLARYTSPGDALVLTVLRDGEQRDFTLTLAERPDR